MKNEVDNSIQDALDKMNKKYGKNAIFIVEDADQFKIDAISTGCISLDNVFGCGGLPRGRVVEIYGQPSSGKSTAATYIAAQVQKQGGRVVWIDVEFAFSTDYARALGLDVNKLILSQPSNAEEALDMIDGMAKTNSVDLIVLDSVAALVTETELSGELTDVNMAQQARLMSKALRMITGNLAKTKTSVIFINQLRDKVGQMFGKKETTPGGNALKFFSSVRLEVKKGENIKDKNGEIVGNKIKINAVKNKVGLPFRTTELDLYYTKGIDVAGDVFNLGLNFEIITKQGNSYYYGDTKLGTGKDASIDFLSNNAEIYEAIKTVIISKMP
jgi:recombination protein RecA